MAQHDWRQDGHGALFYTPHPTFVAFFAGAFNGLRESVPHPWFFAGCLYVINGRLGGGCAPVASIGNFREVWVHPERPKVFAAHGVTAHSATTAKGAAVWWSGLSTF